MTGVTCLENFRRHNRYLETTGSSQIPDCDFYGHKIIGIFISTLLNISKGLKIPKESEVSMQITTSEHNEKNSPTPLP